MKEWMRIGELAAAGGVTTKTVRFYEQTGLLPAPARSANGYRTYTPDTLTRLEFIARGRAAGLSLAQLGEILAAHDTGDAPCAHVHQALGLHLAQIDEQIIALTALRAAVAQSYDTAAAGDPANCDSNQICSYL